MVADTGSTVSCLNEKVALGLFKRSEIRPNYETMGEVITEYITGTYFAQLDSTLQKLRTVY